jgi:hypothetical protein
VPPFAALTHAGLFGETGAHGPRVAQNYADLERRAAETATEKYKGKVSLRPARPAPPRPTAGWSGPVNRSPDIRQQYVIAYTVVFMS